MSLVQRKPRPLERDSTTYRDDRLFIIACDDTYAPKQYFSFFRLTRVHIHVVVTEDGTSVAQHVLNRLLEYQHDPDDQLWLVLDTDHCIEGTHLRRFTQTLREARERDVKIALSRPCFELWLLLHHLKANNVENLEDASAVSEQLREALDGYDKTKLNRENFSSDLIKHAYEQAKHLDSQVEGGEIPERNTTRIYLLLHSILSKAVSSELPHDLRNLELGTNE